MQQASIRVSGSYGKFAVEFGVNGALKPSVKIIFAGIFICTVGSAAYLFYSQCKAYVTMAGLPPPYDGVQASALRSYVLTRLTTK
jgi:hypothetical protein